MLMYQFQMRGEDEGVTDIFVESLNIYFHDLLCVELLNVPGISGYRIFFLSPSSALCHPQTYLGPV